jgi:hypothetical protein
VKAVRGTLQWQCVDARPVAFVEAVVVADTNDDDAIGMFAGVRK